MHAQCCQQLLAAAARPTASAQSHPLADARGFLSDDQTLKPPRAPCASLFTRHQAAVTSTSAPPAGCGRGGSGACSCAGSPPSSAATSAARGRSAGSRSRHWDTMSRTAAGQSSGTLHTGDVHNPQIDTLLSVYAVRMCVDRQDSEMVGPPRQWRVKLLMH